MFSKKIRNLAKFGARHLSGKKRKYPINTDKAKDLPIFDYGVSKKTYNRVYVFGNTKTGALGVPYMRSNENLDKIDNFRSPKRLGFAEKFEVTTAACGFGFTTFAVNGESHKLYGTGLNTDSQIGYHAIRAGKPLEVLFFPQPIALPFMDMEKAKIIKLAAGRAHLIALSNEGMFLLGNNAYGQCGRAIIDDEDYISSNFINQVQKIDGKSIQDVECGQDHSLAITEDGCVYSCGWGADGQTGLGHYHNCSEFTQVGGDIKSENIVKVACRSDFVLSLNDKGEVFGWGNAEYSQVTLPNNEQQLCTPIYLEMLKPLGKIKDIAAGGSCCVVVNEHGEVFVWGYGLLGTGPNVQHSSKPIKIPETLFGRNDFQPNNVVEKVKCGLSHFAAVTNLGDLFTWGRNRGCCLGLGTDKDYYFPFKVSLGGLVKDVHCGVDHTVAICSPFI